MFFYSQFNVFNIYVTHIIIHGKMLQTLISSTRSWRVRLTSDLSMVQTATVSPLYTATVFVDDRHIMSDPFDDNIDMFGELFPAYIITATYHIVFLFR